MNEAIWFFGSTIDSELHAVEGKDSATIELQQEQILNKYLYPEGVPETPGTFADPALMFGKG